VPDLASYTLPRAKPYKYALALLAGTFILPVGAYLNGFPLIYPDSASYLQDGLRGMTDLPRAMGYALFLSPFAASRVLWPVVFVHSAITVVFIEAFLRSVGLIRSRLNFVVLLIVLAGLTPLGWTVSWILPDFTVPLVILGIAAIVVNVSARREIHPGFLCLIGLVAILHSSTIILLPAVSIMAAALGGVQFLIQKIDRTQLRHLLGVLGVLVIGSTAVGTAVNAVALAHFSPLPPYTAPFLLARFAANGLLQDYLAAHCGESRFRICEYQNDLPRNSERFLWDETRPFTRLGAFHGYSREAAVLNAEIIQTYPVRVALLAFNAVGVG